MDCPACGHRNPADAKFCNECGARLGEAGTAPPPLPAHLAEKARASVSEEGERKQVTVLFADVQGSMELAEQTDPEALRQIMDRFFAILCDGVHHFEGTVDKFTGDGIMALFGAPIAHEDHARRACYAALQLREQLARYATEVKRAHGLGFSVRMGLNSGEVVVGSIGEDLTLSYTAIGQTVGLAQRMEQLAEAGTAAYLTENTAALVEGFFELGDLGEFEIKGVSQPLRVHELRGIGEARTRLDVARQRGFSRFVGRDEEMAILEGRLEESRAGHGQVVGVVGEPGVGKSRLCHEFAERCRLHGISVYRAAGLAHAQSVPLLPLLELLREYFGIEDADADRVARQKVAGRLLLLDPDLNQDLPILFDFLGVPDPERPAASTDPETRKRRLLEMLAGVVQSTRAGEAGVILLEDLHWLDPSSDDFLVGFVAAVRGSHTLAVVNYRPEYEAEWTSADHYRQISLEPLTGDAVAELLTDILGSDPSLDGLAELIVERTQGNPFFIEEVVQELIESGSLTGGRGAHRLNGTIEEIAVPANVHSVLAARIDRLPDDEKSVLQAAAVVGREFQDAVLADVAGLDEGDLEPVTARLVDSEFVVQTELYPDAAHEFKHPLTQEVAYGSLLGGRRADLHAQAARSLAALHPERADERAALIADHWERAGETLEAARWHARAAAWAGYKDPAPTLAHWRRVRELAEELPESSESAWLEATSRLWTMQLGWRLGISEEEATEHFRRGLAIAERQDDLTLRTMFRAIYSTTSAMKGNVTRAVEQAREGIRTADESGDPNLRIAMRTGSSYVFFQRGLLDDALRIAEEGIEIGEADPSLGRGLGITSPFAFCLLFSGGLLANLGRLEEADRRLDRGLAVAREQGDLETEAWHYSNRVHWAWQMGEREKALSYGVSGMRLADRVGDVFTRSWQHHWLGLAYTLNEMIPEALAEHQRSLAMSRESGTGADSEPWRTAWLADSHGQAGEPERGLELVTWARDAAEARGAYGAIPTVELIRARLLIRSRGADGAEEVRAVLEEADRLAAEVGYGNAPGLHRLERAELARLEGDEGGRERELRGALETFSGVGATGWVRQIEEQLAATAR